MKSWVKNYLYSLLNLERKIKFDYKKSLKLERFQHFLNLAGNPQLYLGNVIQIAGTKGKGSVAYFLGYILKECGFRVGVFTSPHLEELNERISLFYKDKVSFISFKELYDIICEYKGVLEKCRFHPKWGQLSFFEVMTFMAFVYFVKRKVDFVVLEAGLGARLDSTNVCKSNVVCITRIDYDHQQKLGYRLSDITYEKAGFIKGDQFVVSIRQRYSVSRLLRKICRQRNCVWFEENKDFFCIDKKHTPYSQIFKFVDEGCIIDNINLKMLGIHQIENAGVSIKTSLIFKEDYPEITVENIKKGLEKTYIPARMELFRLNVPVICDCAHNPSSCMYLVKGIKRHFPLKKVVLVFGASLDKDVKKMASILQEISSKVILTGLKENPRLFNPNLLKSFFSIPAEVVEEPLEAVDLALNICKRDQMVLVCGSMFIAGKIRSYLKKNV